jgi:hypothetical protein
MPTIYTCHPVERNNGIRQIHLSSDVFENSRSQPEEILFNTASKSLSQKFREGDEWQLVEEESRISLVLIRRAGSNGKSHV